MSETIEIRTLDSTGQLINGAWQDGESDELQSLCPVNDSVVWQSKQATTSQVDAAIDAARDALPAWWDVPTEKRIEHVTRYAETIKANTDELAELISAETGKPLWESKTEAGAVVGKAAVSIDSFKERRDTKSFELGDLQAVTRFKPFGVLGVLGPFNFPAHLANGHILPALLAGNTVVYKPSELAPAVGQWMAQKFVDAGLPAGVVNLVQGGRDVGIHLANHKMLDGLLFTGSSSAGRALHKVYGAYPEKTLALEMGGNNPLIVHEADDLQAAAYLTVLSAFITAGQRCTCARRLIVVENEKTQPFVTALTDMMSKLRITPYTTTPEPFAATVISSGQGNRLMQSQKELLESGAKAIVEMSQDQNCAALLSPGLLDVTGCSDLSDEEMFGPILSLIRVGSFDDAIKEANNTAYGLSAGLISSNRENYDQFIHQIRAGIVNWNRQTTGATGKMPFGGCGLSGNNRPSAYYAADYCSWPVASLESSQLELPETPMTGIEL